MPSKYKRENGPKAGRHESDPTNCGWDSILRREHLLSQPAIRMLDIPQTKVWGVLIGDTEEGTHYVCFTTCGKNRVGNRFHARVMMSVKREHTHLRCQFDLRAVERPLSSPLQGFTWALYSSAGALERWNLRYCTVQDLSVTTFFACSSACHRTLRQTAP
jgi:hypothetical protein